MGKRGTKPTDVEIHKERGSFRNDRHEKGIKNRSVDFIPMPPDVLNAEGQRMWYEFFSYAAQIQGYLAKVEIGLVEQLCRAWGEYRDLIKIIEVEGRVIINDKGMQIVNPHYRLYNESQDRYYKIMRELGLTPTTRSGVILMKEEEKDEFDEL